MVFSSTVFLFLFLPITLLLVYASKNEFRNVLLLIASLFFYAWGETMFVFVMLGSIGMNFIFGKWVENSGRFFSSKIVLLLCIVFNLGLIAYFKYYDFFINNINQIFIFLNINSIIEHESITLPIGISFFTFQNISYVIDVYRRETQAEKNPVNYALYISFFAHLIAGPIVRYIDIAKDITARTFDYELMASGIKRFIIGLSKKVLIANTLAYVADQIFSLPEKHINTPMAWLAITTYSLQIFFDFSGYSDMAIGLSRMFGFHFLENFNYPYISRSVTEFWRRWHISLSGWFRDYLYIPLGGNRHGKFRTYFNLLLVFFLTGLWHGASWNYIIWGMIHGSFIIVERIGLQRWLDKSGKLFAHIYLLFVVLISWVFFRLEDIQEAFAFIRILFGGGLQSDAYNVWMYVNNEVILVLFTAILVSTPINHKFITENKVFKQFSPNLINGVYILLLALSLMGLATGTYNPFIYFRF
jgi:alginate O-acetyltransferase complex protein AlgI